MVYKLPMILSERVGSVGAAWKDSPRKQLAIILPIVLVLFGSGKRTIGDFSSEQLPSEKF